jgi:predicted DNA-binding transcriptional regulator
LLDKSLSKQDVSSDSNLTGTTYHVYRFLLKQREPVGVSRIQRALGLSSPSVSEYHIKKLLRLGLVREEGGGYVVDRIVVENVIRIGRTSIPAHTGYLIFFVITLSIMVIFLRPSTINSLFFFAVMVNLAALAILAFDVIKTLERV